MAENSWRLTDAERNRGYTYLAEFAAVMVLGAAGPFAVLAARYLYERRNLIFGSSGAPAQAYDSADRAVGWSTLARPAAGSGTLSLRPQLSESARRLGVREGDPVGLVLTGHSYTTARSGLVVPARSGLVVPARIGQQVEVAVPRGTYSLGAFAGRRDQLFATAQPFAAAAGQNVVVGTRSNLVLPLAANVVRPPLPVMRPPLPVVRPRPQRVVAAPPAATCWWCGYTDAHCGCLFGGVRRFLDDL
jgi:hypothetical protein